MKEKKSTKGDFMYKTEVEIKKEEISVVKMMKDIKFNFFEKIIYSKGHNILAFFAASIAVGVFFLNISEVFHQLYWLHRFPSIFDVFNKFFAVLLSILLSLEIFRSSKNYFEKIMARLTKKKLLVKFNPILLSLPAERKKEIFTCLLGKNKIELTDLQIEGIIAYKPQ